MRRVFHWAVAIAVIAALVACSETEAAPPETQSLAAPSEAGTTPVTTAVTFTSDPSGVILKSGQHTYGPTPITIQLPSGVEFIYTLTPEEPYEDYNLYKPFAGRFTPSSESAEVSVWIDRTTAADQERQRQFAAEERERLAQERCARQTASAKLAVENWSWHRSFGYAIAEGLVTNITGISISNIEAVVTFYSEDNAFISSGTALIDYQPLLAGQSSPFTVYTTLNPAMSHARLEFKEFFGGTISTIERSSADC